MNRLHTLIDGFSRVRILCIGDVMLDKFLYGSVSRISPEAPVPIMKMDRETRMLGGAGNVVSNLCAGMPHHFCQRGGRRCERTAGEGFSGRYVLHP
ncbi:MAG: hypothetical protein ACLSUW_09650 [Akkermansia sp.]